MSRAKIDPSIYQRKKPVSCVMINNRLTVSIILVRTLLSLGRTVDHLKHNSMVIQGFDQSEQKLLRESSSSLASKR